MLTEQELQEMQVRCDAATPGPWHRLGCYYLVKGQYDERYPQGQTELLVADTMNFNNPDFGPISKHNAGFIAHARTDLPAALDHIAEQNKVILWLATALANMECGIPLSEQVPELTAGMSPPCPEEIVKVAEESVASSCGKETQAHAFIDRRCPSCDGTGCDACQGGGLVGSYDPVPDIRLPDPSPWADAVRRFRERSGVSIRAMGERVGLTHYDHEAVREPSASLSKQSTKALSFARAVNEPDRPCQSHSQHRPDRIVKKRSVRPGVDTNGGGQGNGEIWYPADTRTRRSVWSVPTRPFPGAHFSTYPPELIRPCILAGCPEGRTVLDPFFGAGTTGVVAIEEGRRCIGVELNPEYAKIAQCRVDAATRSKADQYWLQSLLPNMPHDQGDKLNDQAKN